ncbi:MAG: MSMEG_0567/Sll0786 family nitrogen starvation N-acetyltransferase [Thermodesulfobacteriota bacterium]
MAEFDFKIITNEDELKEYYKIRKDIFVIEQRIFPESDIDEFDEGAIHIAAVEKSSGNMVGGVRCYNPEGNTWIGGRLSAAPGYRNGRVGHNLVRFAVQTVKTRGCTKFLAYVQPQNVRFFERLDWNPVGELIMHEGKPHQLMEADLATG